MRTKLSLLLLASAVLVCQPSAPKPAVAKAPPAKPGAPAGQLQIGAWKNLKFGKLADVQIPDIEVATLKNGIKVYLLENHSLPFISGVALVRTGTLLDSKEKTGLADIAATVVRSGGTKTKSGDQIDEQLENIAASVESSVSGDSATVGFNCLKENLDEVLGVFFDVLSQPEFRQDKIDLIKTQYRSAIARRYDDADDVARTEFEAALYGKDTPFGSEVEYETLDAITRQDLMDFHKHYYHPANLVLTVSGDFDKAAMKARLEQVLGGWAPSGGVTPKFPQVTHKAKPALYFGEKKDVNQTYLSIGHLGGLFSDKDYPALEVMSDIFGGSFDSRLFRKIRTESGYAYSVGGGWGANYAYPGLFRVSASVTPQQTVESIRLINKEIERLRTEPVTDEELRTAKEKVLNSWVFNFDRPTKTLTRLVRYEYYGYPKDYLTQYQKAVASVTKEDILRVAKQFIDPSKFVYTVIGNSDNFKTPLSDLKMPTETLTLKVKEPKQAASAADAGSLAKGKQILGRMQQAVGGSAKLAEVKDLTSTSTAKLGNLEAKQNTVVLFPNQIRQEQTLPFGKLLVRWNGQTGTIHPPNQPAAMPLPPPIQRQISEELFRNVVSLLRSDSVEGRSVNAVSDSEVEITDNSGNSAKLAMDAATGLPSAISYKMMGPQGPADVTNVLKDWRQTGPVKLPYLVEIMQGVNKASEIKMETVTINTGVKTEEIMK